jgi:hypothetical protein
MALSFKKIPDGDDVWGRTRVTLFDVTLDNSYPNPAGYVINAGDVGLKAFKSAEVVGRNKASIGVIPALDLASISSPGQLPTALVFRVVAPSGGSAPSSLVAPGITEGAVTIGGTATGTIPAGGTAVTSTSASPAVSVPATGLTGSIAAGSVAGGIGVEFANGTDLSTLIFRVRFMGL